jgi:hypothetical protein
MKLCRFDKSVTDRQMKMLLMCDELTELCIDLAHYSPYS